nr:TMV resistance protein N-like [Quercus suber]
MKKTRLTVLSIFYHVEPFDVRNQSGNLAKAFAKHEEDTKVNAKDVQAWKAAMKDVGHISGWHVHDSSSISFMALLLPPSSSSKRWKYNVFLSFKGKDTCKKFTDHLYIGLKQKGISTFKDNEKLKQGTSIAPELLKVIEESRIAIVILSRDYASSNPSDVWNHRGTFGEAFAKHEESFKDNIGNVQMWKAALTKVADLAGWDLKDNHESIVIQKIIGRIFSELYNKLPCVFEDLVGMDSCVEEMLDSYLGEGLGSVRFVGICEMGGIGKTNLAQEIYRRISSNFEASSFIANVRRN